MKLEFLCKIDDTGRIAIPAELIHDMGWRIGDTLSVHGDYGVAALFKRERVYECICCKSSDVKIRVNRKDICGPCLENVVEMLAELLAATASSPG